LNEAGTSVGDFSPFGLDGRRHDGEGGSAW
jgi:hypothetical protein